MDGIGRNLGELMYYIYEVEEETMIVNIGDDGVAKFIPVNPENKDYLDYLRWMELNPGNTVEVYVP